MKKFMLVEPTIEQKDLALSFIQEFEGKTVNGSGGLDRFLKEGKEYEDWLEKLKVAKNREVTEEHVPSVTYFLMDESKDYIYGMINIRLALNERLKKSNGNIGYCIRPSQRRKGYNKINLYLGLKVCDLYKIDKVMLDCDIDNEASRKTIIALGGVKEREMYNDEFKCIVEAYWINVKESIEMNSHLYESYVLG